MKKIIELPCYIGDIVYAPVGEMNYVLYLKMGMEEHNRVYAGEISYISIHKNNVYFSIKDEKNVVTLSEFGKTWFLEEAQAQAKLAELERKYGKAEEKK